MNPVLMTIIIAMGVLVFTLVRAWYMWWQIEQAGIDTNAKIVSLRKAYRNKKIVTYEYEASSVLYQNTVQVGYGTFSRLSESDFVKIKYLPHNPKTSIIVGDNTERNMLTLIVLILLVGIVSMSVSQR